MYLTQFPNLTWIQQQSKSNFADRKGVGNVALPQSGWPSVVLNAKSTGAERNNIIAPFSLFMNVQGRSIVKVDKSEVSLNADSYCLANPGDSYDLVIPDGIPTESFNIHFGSQLYRQTLYALVNSHEQQLSSPVAEDMPLHHHSYTHWKNDKIYHFIAMLKNYYNQPFANQSLDKEATILSDLICLLVKDTTKQAKGLERIQSQKHSTRLELFRRLHIARDMIHDQLNQNVLLDKLSEEACLSKFHLLRTFKALFGMSPHQYVMELRFQKAKQLLKETAKEINEIALEVGFEEVNSFYKFFKKRIGTSPVSYRTAN